MCFDLAVMSACCWRRRSKCQLNGVGTRLAHTAAVNPHQQVTTRVGSTGLGGGPLGKYEDTL